jgi:pantoate--beta-alanine ligase
VSLPRLLHSAKALAAWRGKAEIGFVPTMGALHEGHLSLVRRARKDFKKVAVSIFVNPTQFGPGEDFNRYPRTLAADRRLLAGLGDVAVYAPPVDEVYPAGFATEVKISGPLNEVLEARWRPDHFDGVATVVARLFGLVKPHTAYFGLKDYQQFLVVSQMNRDLALGVKILGCPTVREKDGLALSSRNRYLSPEERRTALVLSDALRHVKALAARGERRVAVLEKAGKALLKGVKVQYFAVADARTLRPLKKIEGPAVALTACLLGKTRLIDNLQLR